MTKKAPAILNRNKAEIEVATHHKQEFGVKVEMPRRFDPFAPNTADNSAGNVMANSPRHPITSQSRMLTSGVPDSKRPDTRNPSTSPDPKTQDQLKAAQNTYTPANRPAAQATAKATATSAPRATR